MEGDVVIAYGENPDCPRTVDKTDCQLMSNKEGKRAAARVCATFHLNALSMYWLHVCMGRGWNCTLFFPLIRSRSRGTFDIKYI